jgi:hypothetical protein
MPLKDKRGGGTPRGPAFRGRARAGTPGRGGGRGEDTAGDSLLNIDPQLLTVSTDSHLFSSRSYR